MSVRTRVRVDKSVRAVPRTVRDKGVKVVVNRLWYRPIFLAWCEQIEHTKGNNSFVLVGAVVAGQPAITCILSSKRATRFFS